MNALGRGEPQQRTRGEGCLTHAQWALLLIAAYTLMLIIVLSARTPVVWDEAVFIGMGKHIASGGAFGLFEAFRPFLLPLILAPFITLGIGAVWAAKAMAILFSALTLLITFLLARELSDERTGLLAVLLVMLSPLVFVTSLRMLTEIPSAFFMLLSLYALIKKRPEASGALALISFATRYPSGLILPAAIAIAWIRDGSRSAFRVLLGFVVAFIPLAIAYAWFLEDPVGSIIAAARHQDNGFFAVNGVLANLVFYPIALLTIQPFFATALAARKRVRILAIPVLIVLAYLTVITNKQDRFILVVVPLVAILAASVFASMRRAWIPIATIAIIGSVLLSPAIITEQQTEQSPVVVFAQNVALTGPVGTSDPLFAAYRDVRFVPIYFTYEDLEERMAGLDEVLFLKQAYGCSVFGPECSAEVESAYERLERTHTIVERFEHHDLEYVLFVSNNDVEQPKQDPGSIDI